VLFQGTTRGLLAALLVAAAVWDIRKRKIPNVLSAAVAVSGLASVGVGEGWRSALSGLTATCLVVALLWWPWLRGRIGGGDVKLAGAAATWIGLPLLHEYLLGMALTGGMVAMICYVLSSARARQQMVVNLRLITFGILPEPPLRGSEGRVSVPYGVAASAAALLVVFVRKGW
jgi:Flp pilus assembly protein protease CpaA